MRAEARRRATHRSPRLLPPLPRVPPAARPERMEAPDVSPEAMRRALDAVAAANRRFGGYGTVWRALTAGLARRTGGRRAGRIRLLDVGSGSGHLAVLLCRRLRARGFTPEPWLADVHPLALALARERLREVLGSRDARRARFLRLDAATLPLPENSVDYVVCTTTLHHMERAQAVSFLREAERVSRRGWVVVDLRRSWSTYLVIQALARTLWRRNPLPRADGPLSVRRSFTPVEVAGMLREGGLGRARVRAFPPFRLSILGGEAAGRSRAPDDPGPA